MEAAHVPFIVSFVIVLVRLGMIFAGGYIDGGSNEGMKRRWIALLWCIRSGWKVFYPYVCLVVDLVFRG